VLNPQEFLRHGPVSPIKPTMNNGAKIFKNIHHSQKRAIFFVVFGELIF
jgi:hypothetical protein